MSPTLLRYNSDGTLDNTFGSGGKTRTDFNSSDDHTNSMIVQTNGKIILVGYRYNNINDDFALAMYNPNGTIDTTFNGTGKITTDFAGRLDRAYSTSIQLDGKILVAGVTYNGTDFDIAISRYIPDSGVGISEVPFELIPVLVYPNPSSQSITLQVDSNSEVFSLDVTVFDVLGQEVLQQNILNGGQIDIASLSSGLYIVTATMPAGEVFRGKFEKI